MFQQLFSQSSFKASIQSFESLSFMIFLYPSKEANFNAQVNAAASTSIASQYTCFLAQASNISPPIIPCHSSNSCKIWVYCRINVDFNCTWRWFLPSPFVDLICSNINSSMLPITLTKLTLSSLLCKI